MFPIQINVLGKQGRWALTVAAAVFMIAAGIPGAFAAAAQKAFGSPEDAAKELIAAVKAGDKKALMAILGPGAKAVIESGDAVADRDARERFVQGYEEANKLEKSGDSKVFMSTGKDAWPFPIPIVKDAAGWRFDTQAGKEEILNRRIGRNELYTIQAVQAFVDAQREYYLGNPQKNKLLQYAQKFVSTEGKRDGLYYPTKAAERPSPLGSAFSRAKAQGYGKGAGGEPAAFHGYHYRILKAQGSDAPGGAYDYVVRGSMMGGFALLAYPVSYGNSGVMTFVVNHDGVVYQKDLGPQTAAAAQKITKFNPDKSWTQAEKK